MKNNLFIARCSVILFVCSILVPPLLYVFAQNVSGSDSIIVFFLFSSFILSFIFGILSRDINISRITLFGTPTLVILLGGLLIFKNYQYNKFREIDEARAKAKFEEVKRIAGQARLKAEQDAAANP